MKRFIIILALFIILSGCGQNNATANDTEKADSVPKINIVATIFPQYDWLREIIGGKAENFELTILIDNRIDLHSYQPSISDIAKISTADLFIYVGGHSDDWVDNALAQANPGIKTINMVEALGDAIQMSRLTEGMEHVCDDEECDEDHGEVGELHEEEHVWVSLRMAKLLCEIIAETIISLNPENEDVYRDNLSAYIEKLSALDERYTEMVNAANNNTLVFGDRFPFLYLVDDYGLNHYAAFSGCTAASEASFSTIIILARKLDDYSLNFIMVTETGNHAIAETIIGNTRDKNQQVLVLDGMKAVSSNDMRNGVTYLTIMESNLEVLRKALN
jgi:zinc transport system substrate-binding protein